MKETGKQSLSFIMEHEKEVIDLNFDFRTLFFLTELMGTVAFSISRATLAIKRRLDLFGVVFLGTTTAIGGGIIRDLLLGQVPPRAFLNYAYFLCAAATSLLVFVITGIKLMRGRPIQFVDDAILNFFDAIGLGVFSVVGVQNAINSGFEENVFFCVFLGMTTGVGGVLRDVLSLSTLAILRKHLYALTSLSGSFCYSYLQSHANWASGSIIISTILVVVIRMLASYYHWTLPKIIYDDTQ